MINYSDKMSLVMSKEDTDLTAVIILVKKVTVSAKTESPVFVSITKMRLRTIEVLTVDNLTSYLTPWGRVYKAQSNVLFQSFIANVSRKPITLHRSIAIALANELPGCIVEWQEENYQKWRGKAASDWESLGNRGKWNPEVHYNINDKQQSKTKLPKMKEEEPKWLINNWRKEVASILGIIEV